jgi:restriction system protein
MYDVVLYQLVLRTIHELYESDVVEGLQSITFNGWVTSTDRATGKETTACVLSVQAPRSEFLAINLAAVDPKACFKALKGVGSSKLHSLTAVAPIMQIRREDGRFVSAREIAHTLDDSVNLAAMDWEDFEHLIREVFEREFSSSGGDVKVTRASRDGGVDAVAFDPDPIRGGKIVIQAKRYTNTVGVSAVRDLYGTVMNEGATKGILVSTSDYGPDAYAFAKDKPLVLLSGANLLHLLQKHGHSARIDLKEARELSLRQKPG